MVDLPVKVENVVASATLGVDIPIEKIVSEAEKIEYDTEHSDGIVLRPGEPGVAALIYSYGKVVCTGAKSVEKAKDVIRKVVEKMKKRCADLPAGFDIEIENITATSHANTTLDLQKLAGSMQSAEYDPIKLPGLVYRTSDPDVSFLILGNGKIICSGARSIDEIQRALRKLMAELKKAGAMA